MAKEPIYKILAETGHFLQDSFFIVGSESLIEL